MDKGGYMMMADSLVKSYARGKEPAVDGVDLRIRTGEIFGILGPNGAGKTTTISLLSTLMRPDKGEITINGIDALRHPGRVRRHIGLVPQEIALYPELTARENLRFFGKLYGLRGKELDERMMDCLAITGLSKKADQRVSTYSGGMKRRANMAAGMLHKPKLLFLDEPTVGIDAQSRAMILEKLSELGRSGTTMIYTTHYMEEAETLCNRVAIMDGGKILIRGTPAEMLAANPGCMGLGDLFLRLTGKSLRD